MNKFISSPAQGLLSVVTIAGKKALSLMTNPRVTMVVALLFVFVMGSFGQDINAGLNAITQSTESLTKYVPVVTKLCYALAGVVAIIGAISVYIKMNNEEQDVKNILVFQNWQETMRKQMKDNTLCINTLCDFLAFPMLANLTLKKT